MPECSMLQNWELGGSSHCRGGEVPGRCSNSFTFIVQNICGAYPSMPLSEVCPQESSRRLK